MRQRIVVKTAALVVPAAILLAACGGAATAPGADPTAESTAVAAVTVDNGVTETPNATPSSDTAEGAETPVADAAPQGAIEVSPEEIDNGSERYPNVDIYQSVTPGALRGTSVASEVAGFVGSVMEQALISPDSEWRKYVEKGSPADIALTNLSKQGPETDWASLMSIIVAGGTLREPAESDSPAARIVKFDAKTSTFTLRKQWEADGWYNDYIVTVVLDETGATPKLTDVTIGAGDLFRAP